MSVLLSPIEVGSVEVREPGRVHRPRVVPGLLPPRHLRATATSPTRSAGPRGGAGVIFLQTVHVHPSSHSLGHAIYEPGRSPHEAHGDGDGDPPARGEGRPAAQSLRRPVPLGRAREPRAALGLRRPRHGRGGGRAPDDERRDRGGARRLRADRADLRRGRASTGSSCTAPTATCCSSRSARGATVATTSGASSSPSRRALIARVRRADRPRSGRRPADLDRRLHVSRARRPRRRSGSAGRPCRSSTRASWTTSASREGARTGHYARSIGSYRHALGEFLPLARGLREAIGARVPIVAASRINDPDIAERALAGRRLRHRRDDARR